MFCLLCIMEFENHFPISTGRVLGCLSGMLQDLNFSSAALAVSRQIPGRRWTLLSLSSCLALSAENDLITLLFWDGFWISVCKQSHLTNQLHLVTLCYTCKNAFACAQTAEYRHKYMHFFFKLSHHLHMFPLHTTCRQIIIHSRFMFVFSNLGSGDCRWKWLTVFAKWKFTILWLGKSSCLSSILMSHGFYTANC